MNSTLLPNGKAVLSAEFDVKRIIVQYEDLGLDVSRFFNTKSLKLYRCEQTGYRFFYPQTVVGDSDFYNQLSQARNTYYKLRWEHVKASELIHPSDKVLEVGSGSGYFLELLSKKGIDAKGLEINPDALKHIEKKGLHAESKLLSDLPNQEHNTYDFVCAFQVLEHVYDVKGFLDDALLMLKKGGQLIISVPYNNPYLHIMDKYHTLNLPPHHAGLWNRKSLTSLEKFFNLNVVDLHFEQSVSTYQYLENKFLNFIPNKTIKNLTTRLLRKLRKPLRWLFLKCINGRNILMVYQKV